MSDSARRIHRLFMRKLAAQQPSHPWVLKEKNMQWQQPYQLGDQVCMDIALYQGGVLDRCGCVYWPLNGGLYDVSITYQSAHGLGLYCWPSFRVLSEAQDFVEQLMQMTPDAAKQIHGREWPGVVR